MDEKPRMATEEAATGGRIEGHPYQQLVRIEGLALTENPSMGRSHHRGAIVDQMGHRQTVLHRAQDRHVGVVPRLSALTEPVVLGQEQQHLAGTVGTYRSGYEVGKGRLVADHGHDPHACRRKFHMGLRSEERRVGKECRSRWWPER